MLINVTRKLTKFSPPAWGWSVTNLPLNIPELVLPTRVGMVPGPG